MNEPDIQAVNNDDPDFEMRRHPPVQHGLDFQLTESLQKVRREVSFVNVAPSSLDANQTLNNRRLFDALIWVVQKYFNDRGREFAQRAKIERISPLFEVRISELAKLAGVAGKNYERLYHEIDLLYEWSFDWQIFTSAGDELWANKARLLSSRGIGTGLRRGYVRFSMDVDVLDIILEPNLCASLWLKAGGGLSTAPSYALFQTAWRFLGSAMNATPALPTETWVKLLVGENRYVREETGDKVTVNYADFKRRVLAPAVVRINDIPELSHELRLKEIRQGNRIAKLQFVFLPKQGSLRLPLNWPDSTLQFLGELEFSNDEISLISQSFSGETVTDGMREYKRLVLSLEAAGKSITSRKPYFLHLLRAVATGRDREINHEKIEAEVRQEVAQQAAVERERRVKEGFDAHQWRRFRTWLIALPDQERANLIAEYEQVAQPSVTAGQKLKVGDQDAMTPFRAWLKQNRPDTIAAIFSNPEDKDIQAWMAWRLAGDDALEG